MPAVDTDTLAEEILDDVLPCQGLLHAKSARGHLAEAPGEFALIMPCCGFRLIICRPRRDFILSGGVGGLLSCGRCAKEWIIERVRIPRI